MAIAPNLISRMPVIAAIRASVMTPLVQHIDKRSGKTDLLLAAHGILRSQLDDPYAVVPMARYVALFEDAARVAEEPALGARLGTLFKPGDIGPIGMLFSLSATIRAAFDRLGKYVNAVQGGTNSGQFDEDDNLVWTYRLKDPAMWPRRQDSEFSMAASCQLVRACFNRGWKPVEVHFEHLAPRDTSTLERIFRAPLRFGQSGNRIVVAKADADRVYRVEDAALAHVLERHIADIVGDTDTEPSFTDKVTALIGIYLGHKPISVPDLAAEMGMSARTFQRRLSEQNSSLRQLVRDYRQGVSDMQLAGNVQKSRIAEALGYADSTVYWRATKNWTKG